MRQKVEEHRFRRPLSLLISSSFQCKPDCCTNIFGTSRVDRLAMSLNDVFANRETEPGTREIDASSFFCAIKAFKYARQMFFANTDPIITYFNEHMLSVGIVN